jgi:hypothetical protein
VDETVKVLVREIAAHATQTPGYLFADCLFTEGVHL